MTAILKVDTIQDVNGNNIINESSDTITIGAAGDTVDVPGTEVKTNKVSPTSGTSLQIGDSGDTITIPSGATITNSGTASGFGGITMANQWRITTAQNNMDDGDHVTNNWEQADSYGYGGIGSSMTQSGGFFTFPSTGIYYIQFHADIVDATEQAYLGCQIKTTTNNSSYNVVSQANVHLKLINSGNTYTHPITQTIFDVTDTTTHKVVFAVSCQNNNINVNGNTNSNETSAVFIRLGDT